MFANSQYQESECISLDPGNLLVLITDGLTESQSPEGAFFESKAALETIRLHRQKPAAEIVEHLHDASREFAGGMRQDDDITIVVCKVL
jgi:sigma-B regulation protein RsbU (phosphoserine phosphatase)